MQLYYITDCSAFPGHEAERRRQLLEKISEAARAGVGYIQLREKDLSPRDLEALAREAVGVLRETHAETRLLINSRTDVALAVQADGVHLRGDDISPGEVAAIYQASGNWETRGLLSAVSCHSVEDVRRAESEGANLAVLAPIFSKRGVQALGVESLRTACRGRLPVFALGGVALENARACLDAGATGIAAIRLFQNNRIEEIVRHLRRN